MKLAPVIRKNHIPVRNLLAIIIMACGLLAASGCTDTVPLTGRRQLSLVPAGQLQQMGLKEYDKFLKENKLSTAAVATAEVRRCGKRIQHAVESYLEKNSLSGRLSGYEWEFNLIADDQINAFCMPGGKVAVFEGILPVAKDENGLAVVMAHEIAHAIAQHSRERMSQALLISLGGAALGVASRKQDEKTRQIFLALYGAGTKLGVMLPNSRQQELEADRLGLIFMALAGYDPGGAIPFWQRMSAAAKLKGKPPVFLSTHPTDEVRIRQIKKLIPEAMRYYRKSSAKRGVQHKYSVSARKQNHSAPKQGMDSELERLKRENERLRRELEN